MVVAMNDDWIHGLSDLLELPSPAVLTTYRRDGSAAASPVWFRFQPQAFEIVIGVDDVKLRHLERRPQCSLVVFEMESPYRGVRVEGTASLEHGDVTEARTSIAGRYLGPEAGQLYAQQRQVGGVLVRLPTDHARVWDLNSILPRD